MAQVLIGILWGIAKKFVTERVVIEVVHIGLKQLAKSTKNDVDDQFVSVFESAVGKK